MNFFDNVVVQILLVIGAYLLGSINSAILVSQVKGLPDPRTLGSGNPGATNVLRTGGKLAAAVTLLGDILKGFIPVAIAMFFDGDAQLIIATALAALLGHMYPLYYGFKGGKGVATTLGVLLGFDWSLAVVWSAFWLVVAFMFRYSSLAALIAMLLTPIIAWYFNYEVWKIALLCVIGLIVYWKHRSNIKNLISGDETKIGED